MESLILLWFAELRAVARPPWGHCATWFRRGFVLLYGAGLGSWIGDDVVSKLEYPFMAIDFPGRGKYSKVGTKNIPLSNYVESAISDINQFNAKKIIIVAHSISGVVAIEVSNMLTDRVIGFIAVSASIPSTQGSYISLLPFIAQIFLKIMFSLSGTKPPDSAIRAGLCNDLDEKKSLQVIERFIPESKRLYLDKIQTVGLPENSLYINLKKDQAFNENMQRKMISNLHAKKVIDIDAGHLPMISKSTELAHALNAYAISLI